MLASVHAAYHVDRCAGIKPCTRKIRVRVIDPAATQSGAQVSTMFEYDALLESMEILPHEHASI